MAREQYGYGYGYGAQSQARSGVGYGWGSYRDIPERAARSSSADVWARGELNENLRRWTHWSIGMGALEVAGEIAYAVAVAASIPVLPVVGIAAVAIGGLGILVTGIGTLVNVIKGGTMRKYRKNR